MTTIQIADMQAAYIKPALAAKKIAEQQGRPAYVVQGPRAQVRADFPGVWCFRVHANGMVDCSVISA